MKTEIDELIDWMRKPDLVKNFSLADIVRWINSRPINTVLKLQNELIKLKQREQSGANGNDAQSHSQESGRPTTRVCVGQIFRDTYYDKKDDKKAKRTIRIIEVLENNVRAEVLTDIHGQTPKRTRNTKVSFETLRTGYVAVGQP